MDAALPAPVIRRAADRDVDAIFAIVNAAAARYRDAIPADCWHEPYMARAALVRVGGAVPKLRFRATFTK